MRSNRGFTLMEVLVAIVLMSLFTLVSYRALDAVLQTQRRATAEMERWRNLAAAFVRVESDLVNAVKRFDSRYPNIDGFHASLATDNFAQFDLVRLLPEDSDSSLLRVGYRCKDKSLSRLVWPDTANTVEAPREFVLVANLQTCAFRYMDAAGQWLATWTPSAALPLPRAVELNIVESGGTPLRRLWRVQ